MEKVLKITLKGSKEAVERAESYVEDVLRRNTSKIYEQTLDDFKIERIE